MSVRRCYNSHDTRTGFQVILPMISLARAESVTSGNCLAASALLILTTLSSLAQITESPSHVIADEMEIPLYLPLGAMAGVSAEVTLRLQVSKDGDVTSVAVVSAHADCGWLPDCSPHAGSGWESRFVQMATEAAKVSRFSCSTCGGATFGHVVIYQFQYPPVPKRACTPRPKEKIPPPPPSTVASGHVTVRPTHWPCVSP
jgi:hypothetical protein